MNFTVKLLSILLWDIYTSLLMRRKHKHYPYLVPYLGNGFVCLGVLYTLFDPGLLTPEISKVKMRARRTFPLLSY